MLTYMKKAAIVFLICLVSVASNASAVAAGSCTPTVQSPVAPGDQIDLRGPDVPDDQKLLGITWKYQWTVRKNDASGEIVVQQEGQTISFIVPTEGYADAYYFDLMVTAEQATLCINEACMLFPIEKPGECQITSDKPDQICISDTSEYKYSTGATPGQVNQRWWIFPEDKFPKDPSQISYNGHTEYKAGDGNSITVNWNSVAKKSGVYIVFTGYYAKKAPYAYQGSCQKRVTVADIPSAAISIE